MERHGPGGECTVCMHDRMALKGGSRMVRFCLKCAGREGESKNENGKHTAKERTNPDCD